MRHMTIERWPIHLFLLVMVGVAICNSWVKLPVSSASLCCQFSHFVAGFSNFYNYPGNVFLQKAPSNKFSYLKKNWQLLETFLK